MAGPSHKIELSYEQLSNSKLVRTGDDLTIITHSNLSNESNKLLLKHYFDSSLDLVTTNGSTLKGNIVNLLAVHSDTLDQSYVAFEDPQAIGKITITDGPVNVIRLNQTIQLNEGDFIYLNDVVGDKSGGAVGIAFADQSSISIDPGTTMVIDDFVYDPENPTTGSMNANVLTGNFSFVSGQIAKTGADAMQVTTPVLTIGVRGTQVAGKANTEGEENEIVLLPNEDGTVGEVMIKNESGEVLLTEAYQATTIFDAYTVPTVPVILQKTEVLKKFASTIATTKKTEKVAQVERETEEAVKQKEEAEEEAEELEEEKEELEEEKEELEEEAEKLEEEKEELEEEAEELEEKVEELEEEVEEAVEQKEELEEKLEEAVEEKEEIEEKQEEVVEEIEELEEKLSDRRINDKQREKIEKELEQLEEEFEEIEEEVQELEQEIEIVAEEKKFVEKKVEQIEKEFVEVKEEFVEVEQQVEFVEEKFEEIEQKVEIVEKEVLQVIEKEEIIQREIILVEEKFDAIVEEFEIFQEAFVQEFEDFIPPEEIQQFMEEAPEELIEEFQDNIIEKLEEEKINVQENRNEVEEDEEVVDIFAEENVEEKLEELDAKQEELIGEVDELMEKDMELQEEAQELEEKAKELDEKAQELEKEAQALEAEAERAYREGDQEAIEEIEEQFQELDAQFEEIDEGFQEVDQGFQDLDQEYEQLDEQFEEINEQFIVIDEQFEEVIEFEQRLEDNQQGVDEGYLNYLKEDAVNNPELQDWERDLLVEEINELEDQMIEEGPGYNENDDVFDVPEDEQVVVEDVDAFLQDERQNAVENNVFAQEADDFFNDQEVQEALPEEIDQNVQDMAVINAQNIEEFIDGAGAGINNADDYYAQEDDHNAYFAVVDNNEDLYNDQIIADDWFDAFIADLAEEQNINVAPWLDMPNDITGNENLAVGTTLGYVYGSDANNDNLTFSILSDPSGNIGIDGNRLYLANAISITEDVTFNVLLKVEDPYGASDVDEWQVTVENNHSPVFGNTSAVSLAEDVSTGTTVATISALDEEAETITYSITAGNTGNAFTINSSTGVITTAAALDYETTTSYTLTVTATDSFGNASTTTQTVNVTDVNEVLSSNDPSAWVTTGDGSAGSYKQTIAYAGPGTDGQGFITELGHTAADYSASNLDTYDVVWYLNQNNSGFSNSPFSISLTNWVNAGGVLIMHDRYVNDGNLDSNLPGHTSYGGTTTRGYGNNTSASYQIVDESTSNLLKYGPGGIMVDDTSAFNSDPAGDHSGNNHLGTFNIGGGHATNHGYSTNIHANTLGLSTTNDTSQYVDVVWEHGAGAVYYSTTPLDYYIQTNFAENDAWDAYALNSLHYATSLIFDGYSQIDGTSSADKIYGTAGDDVFWSKDGADEIWSGNGADTFKYTQLWQSDPGSHDTILDFDYQNDKIDISGITNGASISRTLTDGTRFKLDPDNDGTYEMEWELDDYTGTADQVTVVV